MISAVFLCASLHENDRIGNLERRVDRLEGKS